ncbi:putative S-adenosyl-L-methionine-dependent methyltransferase [Lupinus albus]|uniref:Putative S-adenosyl-L-methionine-dependent methyltransferase n=1 Tax=Lupinus albus TaxID=3870 RepID=A0A6A4PX25_LUPAL|nr:putative S-adenosyl-L-methionine-dependent methyltransferase [Lupinus albus]
MTMDSSTNSNPKTLTTNLLFISLLLFTNLLTLFFSSTFYSSTCTPTFYATTHNDNGNNNDNENNINNNDVEDDNDLPPEFRAATSPQRLPLGFNRNFDSDTIHPPLPNACTLFPSLLRRYMTYTVNGSCPDDELFSQKLLLKGCEPLPRRRCRPASPPNFPPPLPFPSSLWTTPSDDSVVWTSYSCKSYVCLINRTRSPNFDDCKDCFDLNGREKHRWTRKESGGLDFSIDDVLATRVPGSVRIGLDIGGGVATFAVRMRERNVTILTTTLNLNGPFNTFIASRGVIPLYLSISQRLPFFDNTLDIVHSMHVLSNWIPEKLLHFLLFDVYRVLRPGGLFWLDHFFCVGDQLEEVYEPMIQSVGFKKVKWVIGRKLDRPNLKEMYLSALMEKPLNNSW